MYGNFTRFSVLQITYENYYYEQLTTINLCKIHDRCISWIHFAEIYFAAVFWET